MTRDMRELQFSEKEILHHKNILDLEEEGFYLVNSVSIDGNTLSIDAIDQRDRKYSITVNIDTNYITEDTLEEVDFLTAGDAIEFPWENYDIMEVRE